MDRLTETQQLLLALVFMIVVGTWRSLGYVQRMWPRVAFPRLLVLTVAGWTVLTLILSAGFQIYFHFFPPPHRVGP